jgi:hypothetical protein
MRPLDWIWEGHLLRGSHIVCAADVVMRDGRDCNVGALGKVFLSTLASSQMTCGAVINRGSVLTVTSFLR